MESVAQGWVVARVDSTLGPRQAVRAFQNWMGGDDLAIWVGGKEETGNFTTTWRILADW